MISTRNDHYLNNKKSLLKGEFKVPLVPLLPLLSVASCLFLMTRLQTATWIVFGISLVIGIAIYFVYGYRNSELNEKIDE